MSDVAGQLVWKRGGVDWVLWHGHRRMGRVVPAVTCAGMYRSIKADGSLSDKANLAWSKNAVLVVAERELDWDTAHAPPKCPVKGGRNRLPRPPMRFAGVPATSIAGLGQ